MTMTEAEVRRLFLDGRAIAIATAPYMAGAILAMSYTLDERVTDGAGCPTMGVTEKGQLLLHPQFIASMKECGGAEAIGFVVLHEVEHILFKHPRRARLLREKLGAKFDQSISGIAMDFTINPGLREIAKNRGPRWWIRAPTGDCSGVWPEQKGLQSGLRYEEYYELLTKQKEEEQKQQPQSKQGEKEKSEGKEKEGGPGDQGPDPGQPSSGKGQGKESPAPCSGCAPGDAGSSGDLSDAAMEAAEGLPEWSEAKKDAVLRQVAAEAKKAEQRRRGTVPAGLIQELDEQLTPPKVDWRAELQSQINHAVEHRPGADDGCWSAPSRRQSGVGWGPGCPRLPGIIEHQPKVCVIADTSGSMGGNLRDILSETMAIVENVGSEVAFIACDSKVHAETMVASTSDIRQSLRGGGGTYMAPAFEAAKKHQPDLIVCITDGYIETQTKQHPGYEVIWALVKKSGTRALQPSVEGGWGRIVNVD